MGGMSWSAERFWCFLSTVPYFLSTTHLPKPRSSEDLFMMIASSIS